MSADNKLIPGWVAWHPEALRPYSIAFTYEACWDDLLGIKRVDFERADEYFAIREAEKVKATEKGWILLPVEVRVVNEGERRS